MSSDEERAAKDSKHLCSSLITQEKNELLCVVCSSLITQEKVSCFTLCAPHLLPKNK
jgi:hypothetical protein